LARVGLVRSNHHLYRLRQTMKQLHHSMRGWAQFGCHLPSCFEWWPPLCSSNHLRFSSRHRNCDLPNHHRRLAPNRRHHWSSNHHHQRFHEVPKQSPCGQSRPLHTILEKLDMRMSGASGASGTSAVPCRSPWTCLEDDSRAECSSQCRSRHRSEAPRGYKELTARPI